MGTDKTTAEQAPQPDKTSAEQVQQELEPIDRVKACQQELNEVLRKYKCRIVSTIQDVEMIGAVGSKVLISSGYGLVPE